ncbi:MAG: NAD(P)-binding domain-containing protein [Gammaproteobacteria bacterium]|nr:NAD(P)-binding domain-containing protein [Gammaproteobacteria bacterium]
MKIGFIGYGNMAKALSKRWATSHEIFIGGRNAESAAELAQQIQASGSGSISEAVEFGDVIVFATPANAVADAIQSGGGAEAFSGKVVIDINNPVNVPGGPHDNEGEYYLPTIFNEGSLAEHIAALIPDAQIVKAFNMCQASVWEMEPPEFDGRKLVALYCGDQSEAKTQVAELIDNLGCDPVDVGELKYARLLEASACIVIKFLFSGRDMRTVLNLIQPEVKSI